MDPKGLVLIVILLGIIWAVLLVFYPRWVLKPIVKELKELNLTLTRLVSHTRNDRIEIKR